MPTVDFLGREIKVGSWVAIADHASSNSSRQRLVLVYELGDKRIKILKKYFNRVVDSYVTKTDHMAVLDKVPESVKKEFRDYYLEKYKEGKFVWNESILGTYI